MGRDDSLSASSPAAPTARPAPRATLADTSRGLEIAIPARRNAPAVLFLAVWLCGWAMGETMVVGTLLGGEEDPVALGFLALWLAGWTVGGVFAIYMFFWMLGGCERIVLSASRITMKREVFGLGRARAYELVHVSNLRTSAAQAGEAREAKEARAGELRASVPARGIRGGAIAFDYQGATIRFGAGLGASEASSIVETMRSRAHFPERAY